MLVEVHDFIFPKLSQTLTDRFSPSHLIERILTEPREAADYPELSALSPDEQQLALSEGRPGAMMWLLMMPRAGPAAT